MDNQRNEQIKNLKNWVTWCDNLINYLCTGQYTSVYIDIVNIKDNVEKQLNQLQKEITSKDKNDLDLSFMQAEINYALDKRDKKLFTLITEEYNKLMGGVSDVNYNNR